MKYLAIFLAFIGSAAFADGFKVGLGGHCPVGYVMAGKQVFGDPKFASEYQGVTYYNSSAEAKTMFDKEPGKYVEAVKYKGYCATGLAMGKKLESDPGIFSKVDGKVYFFSSKEAKAMFDKEAKKYIGMADKEWTKLANK
ncbi:MAG: YHS domain-containing (seleno)protein [Pseudobdellovibrionaceae bacterium]